MTHEDHDAFYSKLELRGVTRRDFLKYCGSIAAMRCTWPSQQCCNMRVCRLPQACSAM